MRTLTWIVPASKSGLTVEEFLRAKGCSHHVLSLLKNTEDGILLNQRSAYASERIQVGDELTIRLEERKGSVNIDPVPLTLNIVYEDEDILVVDKPSNMPVHPSIGNQGNTLANAVMYHYKDMDTSFIFRCVNRLDRDTSGLVLIAKNALSSAILSSEKTKSTTRREYFAIVKGRLPKRGTIDQPISREPDSILARRIDTENGVPALTHYERIGYYKKKKGTDPLLPESISTARIWLETGRTHQIRVHMASIGHPIPGDFLYDAESVCDLAPRQMLHACRLTFLHPITEEKLTFEAGLPADIKRFLSFYEKTQD